MNAAEELEVSQKTHTMRGCLAVLGDEALIGDYDGAQFHYGELLKFVKELKLVGGFIDPEPVKPVENRKTGFPEHSLSTLVKGLHQEHVGWVQAVRIVGLLTAWEWDECKKFVAKWHPRYGE